MCRLRTRSRTDVHPQRVELPSAGHIVSPPPGAITCFIYTRIYSTNLHKSLCFKFINHSANITRSNYCPPVRLSHHSRGVSACLLLSAQRAAARRSAACGQCHVDSCRRKLTKDLFSATYSHRSRFCLFSLLRWPTTVSAKYHDWRLWFRRVGSPAADNPVSRVSSTCVLHRLRLAASQVSIFLYYTYFDNA